MALPPVITTIQRMENIGRILAKTRQEEAEYLEWCARLAREAHKEGKTVSEIARAAGVTRPTIYQWLKEEQK